MNPYSNAQPYQMWRRAVSALSVQDFDPIVSTKFKIEKNDRIATAGSCFAQHISRHLSELGYNFYVAEDDATLPPDERARRNYGVFSARYGNIYTSAQLLQLFNEALEGRTLREPAWRRKDGRYVDPFRPAIEPAGFETPANVAEARRQHLRRVKELLTTTDVFVFTLGLTETWVSAENNEYFPLAPGVSGGEFDPQLYLFKNLSVFDVETDMTTFFEKLKAVNPRVKCVLTVSPVPLIATFEDRNVLVSTTLSKSVLRVAADTIVKRFSWVDYYPSFEIITGSFNFGGYYEDDAREVNSRGVAHAMRCFSRHYIEGSAARSPSRVADAETPVLKQRLGSLVCDEEAIAAIKN